MDNRCLEQDKASIGLAQHPSAESLLLKAKYWEEMAGAALLLGEASGWALWEIRPEPVCLLKAYELFSTL